MTSPDHYSCTDDQEIDACLLAKVKALSKIGHPITHRNMNFIVYGQKWGRLSEMLALVRLKLAYRKVATVNGYTAVIYGLTSLGLHVAALP